MPCLSGRGRRIPANLFGALVATNEEPRRLVFVARKGSGLAQNINLEGMTVAHEPKFLSENLVIFPEAGKGGRFLFIFPRSQGPIVEEITQNLRARSSAVAPAPVPEETEEREAALQA